MKAFDNLIKSDNYKFFNHANHLTYYSKTHNI